MDDFVYRSAVPQTQVQREQTSSQDEANYDTLISIRDYLTQSIEALYKDFNAFALVGAEDPDVAARRILVQASANQKAHIILETALQHITASIDRVDARHGGRK